MTIRPKYLSNVYGYLTPHVGMENSISRLVHTVLYVPADEHEGLKSKILPRIQSKLLQYDKSITMLKDVYDKLNVMEQDSMMDIFYNYILPDIYGDKSIDKSKFDYDENDMDLDMSDIERLLWKTIREDVFNSVG